MSGHACCRQRHLDTGLVGSAHKVDGANDTSRICVMRHMSGAREDIEHASRHLSVKSLRLRFQVDDRIGVAGENGDRTGQSGIAVCHPECIWDHVRGVLR